MITKRRVNKTLSHDKYYDVRDVVVPLMVELKELVMSCDTYDAPGQHVSLTLNDALWFISIGKIVANCDTSELDFDEMELYDAFMKSFNNAQEMYDKAIQDA